MLYFSQRTLKWKSKNEQIIYNNKDNCLNVSVQSVEGAAARKDTELVQECTIFFFELKPLEERFSIFNCIFLINEKSFFIFYFVKKTINDQDVIGRSED